MTPVLDRYFVHRLRIVAGKDCNPLNEVEAICDSVMNNAGIFRAPKLIKNVPDQFVVRLEFGAEIRLTAGEFESLTTSFYADLESKFAE